MSLQTAHYGLCCFFPSIQSPQRVCDQGGGIADGRDKAIIIIIMCVFEQSQHTHRNFGKYGGGRMCLNKCSVYVDE